MASACSTVLALPPRLAAITPCRITQKRSRVTPISRNRITTVTHQGSRPRTDSPSSAVPVSALSAIGSASLPNSVTWLVRRGIMPAVGAGGIAPAKNSVAQIRRSWSSPPSDSSSSANSGTTASRNIVSALGRFTRRTDCGGVAAGSAAPSGTAALMTSGPGQRRHHGARDQVDTLGVHDGGGQQLAGDRIGRHPGDGGRAVGVGVLVGGVPGPGARALDVGQVLGEQHLDLAADPLLGALGGELLDQVGDPPAPRVDLGLVELAAQPDGLGALLVGVA